MQVPWIIWGHLGHAGQGIHAGHAGHTGHAGQVDHSSIFELLHSWMLVLILLSCTLVCDTVKILYSCM